MWATNLSWQVACEWEGCRRSMGSSAGKGARTTRSYWVSRIEGSIVSLLTEQSTSDTAVMITSSYGNSTFYTGNLSQMCILLLAEKKCHIGPISVYEFSINVMDSSIVGT